MPVFIILHRYYYYIFVDGLTTPQILEINGIPSRRSVYGKTIALVRVVRTIQISLYTVCGLPLLAAPRHKLPLGAVADIIKQGKITVSDGQKPIGVGILTIFITSTAAEYYSGRNRKTMKFSIIETATITIIFICCSRYIIKIQDDRTILSNKVPEIVNRNTKFSSIIYFPRCQRHYRNYHELTTTVIIILDNYLYL